MLIFHIVEKSIFKENLKNNTYETSTLKREGFIHCCTFDQLLDVANNNLKNISERLVVLCLNTNYLKSEIKWEKNERNGMIFPHVYGEINGESIVNLVDFEKNENNEFFISDELNNYSKYEKSCGALIGHKVNNEYKFLLIGFTCPGDKEKKLYWGFPKGHMENNETEIETAKREIKEEVGLKVKINPSFRASTYFSCQKGVTLEAVYYAAVTDSDNVKCQKGEVDKYLWCKPEEVYDYLTFECDKIIFNELKEFFVH